MSKTQAEPTETSAANRLTSRQTCSTFIASIAKAAGVDITIATPVEVYLEASGNLCVNFVKHKHDGDVQMILDHARYVLAMRDQQEERR